MTTRACAYNLGYAFGQVWFNPPPCTDLPVTTVQMIRLQRNLRHALAVELGDNCVPFMNGYNDAAADRVRNPPVG